MAAGIEERVERHFPAEIRALSAYRVADASGLVKLDAMENPYRWPSELVDALLAELRDVEVNRYPDPRAGTLVARMRKVLELPHDMEVMLGNGSDELIQLLMLGLRAPDDAVLAPEPSFAMYGLVSRALGLRYVPVPLDPASFELDIDAMLQAIETHRPRLVFLAYPNNPTGNLFEPSDIEAIVERTPGVVVVDEAYAPFAKASFLPALGRLPNLLVLRTLSKLGLAGLRLGYLVGPAAWLGEYDKLRLPYNINVLTQVSADFALRHYQVFLDQAEAICRERDALFDRLSELPRLHVWPSRANFVLARAPGAGNELVERLKDHGVLVRSFHGASPLLEDCVRISVGTPEENAVALEALRRVLD